MSKKLTDKDNDFEGGTAMWRGVQLKDMTRGQLYEGFEELGKLYGESITDNINLQVEKLADNIKHVFSKKKFTQDDLETSHNWGLLIGIIAGIIIFVFIQTIIL